MSEIRSKFEDRHIGPNSAQVLTMLKEIGESDLEKFIAQVVPANIVIKEKLNSILPAAASEIEAIAELREMASKNSTVKSLLGMGYYGSITPPVILRNVLENPAWYTAYTPYQPEISQGRLEAIFAFQTVIADLTGLPISNASMLDEATSAAEAMTLARRVWKGSDDAVFVIDVNLHPHISAVIHTRAKPLNIAVVEHDFTTPLAAIKQEIFGAVIAQISTYGEISDPSAAITSLHAQGAIAIMTCDLLAATLIKSPGEWGADVAVGSAQRFGIPMGFGGPHAGFMSVRQGLERSIPGRLVGQSIDSHGNPAFRLALQTREQHIRRDKATSNICTAQVLLANMSGFYAMWHGPQGLTAIAERIHGFAESLRSAIASNGGVVNANTFDTVTVSGINADSLVAKALTAGFNIRKVSSDIVSLAVDETTTSDDVKTLGTIFGVSVGGASTHIAPSQKRTSDFLTHPLFHTFHSETSMLRYLRALADKDLALDRTMIPLGSCTMKLNATTEMIPVTWPEFSGLHPFAPADQS